MKGKVEDEELVGRKGETEHKVRGESKSRTGDD